jgi:leucyl aminopeptidase
MQFSTKTLSPEKTRSACAIVPVVAGKLTESGKALDAVMGGALADAIRGGDLSAKAGSVLLVATGSPVQRTLLVAFGDEREVTAKSFLDGVRAALRLLQTTAAKDAVSLLLEVAVADRDDAWKLRSQVLGAREAVYRFEQMKSKRDPAPRRPDAFTIAVPRASAAALEQELTQTVALADGMDLARDLGNLPGNVCTPTYLAEAAKKLGKEFKLKVEVLEEKQMRALKMGALLAVAQGSDQPPRFIVMHYQGAGAKQAPVVLVGKGITFDTGGISIKPSAEMDEMKYDMCGAASVLGTMRTIATIGPKVNVIGVIPTCENMPSGRATRPGDVVTSMSGQTVEILNTDAEGRLILCDALTYVERFKPQAVVDVATLTGACVIALGHHHSGLFSRSDALADELVTAGREIGDTCWRMPLDDEYQESLKSNFADMGNIGGRAGGAVTAACFLSRFTKAYDWAHLDIAGTAWKSGAAKGASGRPVPLLTRFVLGRAGTSAGTGAGSATKSGKAAPRRK